ncbi:MAG: iron-containing alcohol dehydrogenase [Planctomycetes bacterium]|nr:iron-containing alcohol dehydrogenase [Planctomycetota bacterium]
MSIREIRYDLLVPPRVAFGWGRRSEAGEIARGLGRRAWILHGSRALERSGLLSEISASLMVAGVQAIAAGSIHREPEVADVDRTAAALRTKGAGPGDLIVAVGGGSAIDLAKAAAALVVDDQSATVKDYLEGVGRDLRIRRPPLPVLAMPATSGTGSEATKNAVISSFDPPFKKSLRSDLMVPRAVLIDPELTVSVPPDITAHTGMDAITQLIESYISRRARPVPRALALEGLEKAAPALPAAVRDGSCRWAREAMAHAAFLSGLALANSGLGMAHGVAAALGVHCRIPHGLACALLLPAALRANRQVSRAEIARVGRALTGKTWPSDDAAADAAIDAVDGICAEIGIPRRLSEVGVEASQLAAIIESSRGNSMSGNPRELSDAELREILEEML